MSIPDEAKLVSDLGADCGPEPTKELERKLFEWDAEMYGFDLTRATCAAHEPWSEYEDSATGHRWAGWLARNGDA